MDDDGYVSGKEILSKLGLSQKRCKEAITSLIIQEKIEKLENGSEEARELSDEIKVRHGIPLNNNSTGIIYKKSVFKPEKKTEIVEKHIINESK